MEIVGGAADEVFVLEALDVMGFDADDVVHVLETAGDEEKRFLGNDEAKLLEQLRLNNGVRDARFIFKAYEHEALGCAGALTANDIAGDSDDLLVAGVAQIGRAEDVVEFGAN